MSNGHGEREGEAGKGKVEVTAPLRGYKLSMMMLTYKLGCQMSIIMNALQSWLFFIKSNLN